MELTNGQKLNRMMELQATLDASLLEKGRTLGKIEEYTPKRVMYALIDELGELVHELKGDWCWWKATQQAVDDEKVLEELVDVWHFALSLMNSCHFRFVDNYKFEELYASKSDTLRNIVDIVYELRNFELHEYWAVSLGIDMVYLSTSLGFTIDDIYQGYLKKNEANFQRIADGY